MSRNSQFSNEPEKPHLAEVYYDFAVDGGAEGAHLLPGAVPSGALIYGASVRVFESLAGDAVDLSIGGVALVEEGPVSGWDVGLVVISINPILLAENGQVRLQVHGAPLTAGKFAVYLQYVMTTEEAVDDFPTRFSETFIIPTPGGGGAGAADLVTYTPGEGGDWTDPDPTTVAEALDALAAAPGGAAEPFTEAVSILMTAFARPAADLLTLETIVNDFNLEHATGAWTGATLALPALASVGGDFNAIGNASLITLDVGALAIVGGGFSTNGNASLTTIDLGALVSVEGSFDASSNDLLTTLDVGALATVGGNFDAGSNASLTTLDVGALATVGGNFDAGSNAVMTTLTIDASLLSVGGDFNASECALTEAVVDNILVRLAALDGTGGTTTYDNHTIDLSGGTNAAPSATGLAAKATLELRGNTVTVNP